MEKKKDKKIFNVYSYTLYDSSGQTFCHWSKGLNMVIEKDGVTIKLNGEELQQLVKTLPRTFGGSY